MKKKKKDASDDRLNDPLTGEIESVFKRQVFRETVSVVLCRVECRKKCPLQTLLVIVPDIDDGLRKKKGRLDVLGSSPFSVNDHYLFVLQLRRKVDVGRAGQRFVLRYV